MYFVLYGSEYLYDPRSNDRILTDLSFTASENSVNYCDFTINSDHPLYSTIKVHDPDNPVIVKEDSEIIFAGYIYELGTNFQIQGEVKCQGDLSLLDEVIIPDTKWSFEGSAGDAIEELIDKYNNFVGANGSTMPPIEINVNEGNDLPDTTSLELEYYDHPTVLSVLNDIITDRGGFMKMEWSVDKYGNLTRMFNFFADWTNENTQILDFGVNLLDYSKIDDGSELYTAILPMGTELQNTYLDYEQGYTQCTERTNSEFEGEAYTKSETYTTVTDVNHLKDSDGEKIWAVVNDEPVALTWERLKPKATQTYYCSAKTVGTVEAVGSYATQTFSGYYVGAYNSKGQNITAIINDRATDKDAGNSGNVNSNGELTTTRDFWGNLYDTKISQVKRTPVYTTSYSYYTYSYQGLIDGSLASEPIFKITGQELIDLGFESHFPVSDGEFTTIKNWLLDKYPSWSEYSSAFENKFYVWTGVNTTPIEVNGKYGELSDSYEYCYKTVRYSQIDDVTKQYSCSAPYSTSTNQIYYNDISGSSHLYSNVGARTTGSGSNAFTYYYATPSISEINAGCFGSEYVGKLASLRTVVTSSYPPTLYYWYDPQNAGWYRYDSDADESEHILTLAIAPSESVDALPLNEGFDIDTDNGLVYCPDAIEKYGLKIGRYQDTSCTTADELYSSAVKELINNFEVHRTIEIKAIDMHLINSNYKPLRIGDYVRVRSKPHNMDAYFIVRDVDISLVDPTQSTYTLGFDPWELTDTQIARMNTLYAKAQQSNIRASKAAIADATDAASYVNNRVNVMAGQISGTNIFNRSRKFDSSYWDLSDDSTLEDAGAYSATQEIWAYCSEEEEPYLQQTVILSPSTFYTLSFMAQGEMVKNITVKILNAEDLSEVSVDNVTEINPLGEVSYDEDADMNFDVYDETTSLSCISSSAYITFKMGFRSLEYVEAIVRIEVEWADDASQYADLDWSDYQEDPNE